ncbi:MAG: ATP-binding protein [Bacteroidetes bacterium]|nr:ATP-binding protein [Bacteroidota bacterium]
MLLCLIAGLPSAGGTLSARGQSTNLAPAPVVVDENTSSLRMTCLMSTVRSAVSLSEADARAALRRAETAADCPVSFGYSDDEVWRSAVIRSNAAEAIDAYLEIVDPSLDDLWIVVETDSTRTEWHTGDDRPFRTRPVNYRNFVVPIAMKPNTEYRFLLRAHSTGPLRIPVRFLSARQFEHNRRVERFFLGGFFGILAVMALFNLLIFTTTGERPYLFFVLYISAFLLYMLAAERFLLEYVWPNLQWWDQRANSLFATGVAFLAVQFSRSYFKTDLWLKSLDRILLAVMLCCIPISFYVLFGDRMNANLIVSTFFVLVTPMLAIVAAYCLKRGYRAAIPYLAAWSFLLIGTLAAVLSNLSVISGDFWSIRAVQFGAVFQMPLLSLALGYRYNTLLGQQQATRRKLSREMHDEIGPGIWHINNLAIKIEAGSEDSALHAREIQSAAQELHSKLRMLQDAVGAEEDRTWSDVVTNIRTTVRTLLAATEIDGRVATSPESGTSAAEAIRLSSDVYFNLFRIVQEALTNAIRHSNCKSIRVQMAATARSLSIEIHDDGSGFIVGSTTQRSGLRNFRERAAAIGAEVAIESKLGEGTTVRVKSPVASAPV